MTSRHVTSNKLAAMLEDKQIQCGGSAPASVTLLQRFRRRSVTNPLNVMIACARHGVSQ